MADSNAPWPLGPFEREPHEAWTPPEVRDADWLGDRGAIGRWQRERMMEALAGVELGAYDRLILGWLLPREPSTLAVIAGWVKRARRDAGAECPGCDRRGLDIRQEANGDLVCYRCGRMVAPTPPEEIQVRADRLDLEALREEWEAAAVLPAVEAWAMFSQRMPVILAALERAERLEAATREVAAFIRQQADHPGDDGIVKLFPEHLHAWADLLDKETPRA